VGTYDAETGEGPSGGRKDERNKKFWEEFAYFPYISYVFEVLKPNFMKIQVNLL
jgi:hypothetical protein